MSDIVERLMKISSGGFPRNTVLIGDDGSGEPSVIAVLPDVEGDVVGLRFNSESEVEIDIARWSVVASAALLVILGVATIASSAVHAYKIQDVEDEDNVVGIYGIVAALVAIASIGFFVFAELETSILINEAQ